MVFNSAAFLIFFPVVTFLYYLLPNKFRWFFLLLSSYYFYIAWNYKLIWLILFTTVVTYISALLMNITTNKALRKAELTVSLICCLGVLVFFKYFDFLSLSITRLLNVMNIPVREYVLNLILPVGISFYTFQTLSYVIDVYYKRICAEKHFGYYALYVSFFPQLVAGPIERPDSLIPQLKKENIFSFDNLTVGINIMISGFVKKVVVADTIAVHVNAVYNNTSMATGLATLVATILFAAQIYCDFSGYTDIAIGSARIMGIRLMKNFDYPYTAKSIKEFWSRWHISLSSWLRDYIYIPLGGNRLTKTRNMINIFIVFLISGIWHGAAWTFVLWGVIHALYQIVGELTLHTRNELLVKLGINLQSKFIKRYRQLITFLLVDFAWLMFRANSIYDSKILIKKLFFDWELSSEYIVRSMNSLECTGYQLFVCVLCIMVMILCDILYANSEKYLAETETNVTAYAILMKKNRMYLLWLISVAWLLLLSGNGSSSFIYFQF